jgi:hypothetical protein
LSPSDDKTPRARPLGLAVRIEGPGRPARLFTSTVVIGRGPGCQVRVEGPGVAEHHVQLVVGATCWWVRDLDSPAGTYVDGARASIVPLRGEAQLALGWEGPVLRVTVLPAEGIGVRSAPIAASRPRAIPAPPPAPGEAAPAASAQERPAPTPTSTPTRSHAEFVRHIEGGDGAPAGPQTMVLRKALLDAKRRSARPYRLALALLAVALAGAGGGFAWQARKLAGLHVTAESLYYSARELDLQTARLAELIGPRADPALVAEVAARRARLGRMEAEYDAFVKELGVYAHRPEDEQIMLRVARQFGECDANVPAEFLSEVRRYVQRWGASDRLARGLRRARDQGYAPAIGRAFTAGGLPRQYLYLALLESDFDDRAIGPATRYGHAKGMWQFIPATGSQYGLRIGPRHGEAVFDAQDDRFDWRKATGAAVKLLRDLSAGEAQGSGLLAMASYNWGSANVRQLITALPESPRERNFWRLLRDRRVPAETYDYVMSIFSAAVICERPALFGMDVACPEPERTASN